ncbi:MAG: ORF6N domain-containing protein [Elusimicrobiota bacterium]
MAIGQIRRNKKSVISLEIEKMICIIRDKKIMIDADLARLYGVSTKRLNEQVKRNKKRFPSDFMFILNKAEKDELVANCDRFQMLKHSTVLPYAFTEQGVAMLSSVLHSEKAINVNIKIMRVFIQIREMILAHKELNQLVNKIEKRIKKHDFIIGEYGNRIQLLAEIIEQMLETPKKKINKIGFIKN